MKVIDPPFKVCEEILETLIHFKQEIDGVEEKELYEIIGKTPAYIKKAIIFLEQLEIIHNNGKVSIDAHYKSVGVENIFPNAIIKKGITKFKPFKEYIKLIQSGKKEDRTIKLIKTTYNIDNNVNTIKNTFTKYIQFLESEVPVFQVAENKITGIPKEDNFFWIDENGHLIYDEKAHTEQIIKRLESKRFKNPAFIDQNRITALQSIKSSHFDLAKLTRLSEEINDAYRIGNYFTVGILVRAILDHIPPIFNKKNFSEVANNHGTKSFKDVMHNLESFSRKIADGMLHTHIRKNEPLPNSTTVECRTAIDTLLAEIIKELT